MHVEDVHQLLLRLTPPPAEPEDSSIGCAVRLPNGTEAEAAESVWEVAPLRFKTESLVVPPQHVKTGEKWNDYYFAMFPNSFRTWGATRLDRLDPGTYIVTWSRDHGFGRQILRRCIFAIDSDGLFAEE